MESKSAVEALAALAQETRLAIFRLLVEAGPDGVAAGVIAEQLKVAPATLSFHLAQLSHAGMVTARQRSRFVFYAANFGRMDELIAFLTEDCCRGCSCLPRTEKARRSLKEPN